MGTLICFWKFVPVSMFDYTTTTHLVCIIEYNWNRLFEIINTIVKVLIILKNVDTMVTFKEYTYKIPNINSI